MTSSYANPFGGPENLTPTQQRTLLSALALALGLTVLALAWGSIAARLGPGGSGSSQRDPAAFTLKDDTSRAIVVERGNAPWVLEDGSF